MPQSLVRRFRFLLPAVISIAVHSSASAAQLDNDIDGNDWLSVSARHPTGGWVRPGKWSVLLVAIDNRSDPFDAAVILTGAGENGTETLFETRGPTIATGRSVVAVTFQHNGRAAGWRLRVSRDVAGDAPTDLFSADVSSVFRPLSSHDRLILAVGTRAFPLPARGVGRGPSLVFSLLGPRNLPSRQAAFGSVDLMVIERASSAEVSEGQVRAVSRYILAGGTVVFVSPRAMASFDGAFGGIKDGVLKRERIKQSGWPDRVEADHGFGRIIVFDAGAGQSWSDESVRDLLERECKYSRSNPWLDPTAAAELASRKPFAAAANRGRLVALGGALLVAVAVALTAGRKRRVVLAAVMGTSVAMALLALLLWGDMRSAARIVGVRVVSPDGRATMLLNTVVVSLSEYRAVPGMESDIGPFAEVCGRAGELTRRGFALKSAGPAWQYRRHGESGRQFHVVRSVTVEVPTDPAGSPVAQRSHFSGADDERMSALARRSAELAGASSRGISYHWIKEPPAGVTLLGVDVTPDSGTLTVELPKRP